MNVSGWRFAGVSLVVSLTFRCDDQPLALEGWTRLTHLTVRRTAADTELPIRVDNELNLWAGTQEVARAERAAFIARLDERAGHGENHEVRLPPEDLTLRFTHEGRAYGLLFLRLNRGSTRGSKQPAEYRTYGDNCLLFEQ